MSMDTAEYSSKTRVPTPLPRSGLTVHADTFQGKALDVLGAAHETVNFYFRGSNPAVKTIDEETGRIVSSEKELTPAQREYEAHREHLFAYKNFSPELIGNVLAARAAELEDAISKAPHKSAAERDGNTLGNMLELTRMAQDQLSGKLNAKETLINLLGQITGEEETKVETNAKYATTFSFSRSFPNSNAKWMVQNEADLRLENFRKGKVKVEAFMNGLKNK